MLRVRHRAGALAGTEQAFDEPPDRIVFGRDPSVCDVVFPSEETLIARRHFALVRTLSGDWTVESFGTPFVAINGEPAGDAAPVRSGDLIELGRRGGPGFEIEYGDRGLSSRLPQTAVQEQVVGSYRMAKRNRMLALSGIAAGALAIVGTGLMVYWAQADAARLDRAVATLAETQERTAAESIGTAVRDRLLAASYVVIMREANGRERATGTATPVGPDLLGTNAHVVEIMSELGAGGRLLVRAPGPEGRTYEVVEGRLHPGYAAFAKFRNEDPLVLAASKDCPTCPPTVLTHLTAYDVGLLRVKADVPLSPILEIASDQELAALRSGTALAMAGYPLERIAGSEVQHIGATPTLSVGMVTALTDFFNLPAEPVQRKLVQHNLPGTGGNSGSPVVLPSGRIAAFHNAGSYIFVPEVGRVPNAAMIRYAQRADLLRELIEGRADASLAEDRNYWARQSAAFKRGIEAIVPWILARGKPQANASPTLSSQSKHRLDAGTRFAAKDNDGKDVHRRQHIHPVTLKAGQPVTFIAYGQNRVPLQLYLVIDGNIVSRDARGVWYPDLAHRPQADATAQVYVVGGDRDAEYTFMEYGWDTPKS